MTSDGDDAAPVEGPVIPPVGYATPNAVNAALRSMARLQRALVSRKEHRTRAESWDETKARNHFGDSIRVAMELGRTRDSGE